MPTPAPGPSDRSQPDTAAKARSRRPRVMTLLVGALDAHHNHLDYFDTVGGQELRRLYREYRQQRGDGGDDSKDSEGGEGGGTKDPHEQDQSVRT